MRYLKFGLWLLTGACVILGIYMYLNNMADRLSPMMKYNADINKQRIIADAIVKFISINNGKFPRGIGDLVSRGLLPEYSDIYCSPYDYEVNKKINFKESSYRIVSQDDFEKVKYYIVRKDRDGAEVGETVISGIINDALAKRQSQP